MVRVMLLARVSEDSSGIGRSVSEQIQEGERWVEREEWDLVKTIKETGSASRYSSRRKRKEWSEALEWISSGKIDILMTWENSRATRDLAGYTELRDYCVKYNVKWAYAGQVYDLSQRSDRFRTGLDALLAEDEAARTSERVRRAISSNAAAGLPISRNLYGYQRVYDSISKKLLHIEEHPEQAPVVREAARRVLRGESLYAIAKDFNERGIAPRRPKRSERRASVAWTSDAIRQMLLRPGYAGYMVHKGEIVGDAIWKPLIPRDDWHKIQAIFAQSERRREQPWKMRSMLTGVVRCGQEGCTGRLIASQNNLTATDGSTTRYRTYACERRGGHMSVKMDYLDTIVSEYIIARLSRPGVFDEAEAELETKDERARIQEEIDGYREWLDRVRERALKDRNIDALFDQERRVLPLIREAEERLRHLTPLPPQARELADAPDVRAHWQGLEYAEQREIVGALMRIVVRPAQRIGARGLRAAWERTEIDMIRSS